MASLYATQTRRGLQLTWTGEDLGTGFTLNSTNLQITFQSRQDNTRFVGAGSWSGLVVVGSGLTAVSTVNYAPNASDVKLANVGEWNIQLKATFNDGSIDYSTPAVVEILQTL